jgi:hypothetical protein
VEDVDGVGEEAVHRRGQEDQVRVCIYNYNAGVALGRGVFKVLEDIFILKTALGYLFGNAGVVLVQSVFYIST